jgi:protein-disulfide isomerase
MDENQTASNDSNSSNNNSSISENKKNDWKTLSAILGIVIVGLLIFTFYGRITGNVVSSSNAGEKLVSYLNAQTGGGVTFVSSKDIGNLYEITVSYQEKEIPVYITKDGNYFVQGAVPITGEVIDNGNTTATEVIKSDKPVVEAFVFSYCPFGLQFQKALQPVYDLLRNKADIKLVAIGAMHGEYEKIESLRQICIEKNYGKDKLWVYLKDFMGSTDIGACSGADACVNPLVEKILLSKGMNKAVIENCMKTDAEKIFSEQNARAAQLEISGSPTFVINGAKVNVGRNAETIKKAICDAFTTAPSECSKTLSTESASSGFGYSASGAASSSAQC